LSFLGHHVSAQGISPLSSRIQAVAEFPQPVDKKKLREFLGMVNFYHRFIHHCAGSLNPLHKLLSNKRNHTLGYFLSKSGVFGLVTCQFRLA
jgi:cleavage and polyadenylation specificity factor subunit 1